MTTTKVSKKDLIQQELEQILAADPQNMLRAEAVVAFADDHKDSALHAKFPWNDKEAARLKRLDIARGIIRVYRIVVNEAKPEPFRAYVSLTTDRSNGGGYRPAMTVISDEEMKKQLIADFYRTMKGAMNRFNALRDIFPDVFSAIEAVIAESKKATA